MSEVPEGWVSTTLGQVVNYADNDTIEPTDMPSDGWLLELEDIERDTGKILEWKTVAERAPKSSKNQFHSGDVLYGKLRPYLNKVVKAEKDGLCSSEIVAVSPGLLDQNYLFYSMRSPNFCEYVSNVSHGMRMPRLGTQQAKCAPFMLPPLAEQVRIAAKLDELLAQVDTLKARIGAISALLKRFRQSVLAAAVSGQLTEEWRVASLENEHAGNYVSEESKYSAVNLTLEIPKSWKAMKLSDACRVISGFAFSSDSFITAGIPVIKISNVQYGRFETKNQEYLPADFIALHKKFIVNPADLLMALTRPITNNTLKVCEYPKDATPALLNQRVCKFAFDNPESKKFFEYLFQAEYFKKQVASNLSETLQPNLSPKSLELIAIGLPPLQEQTEIVRRIEQLFAFADQLEARIQAAQLRIDLAPQSILAKAFKGDLVPQDPNDEPASVLLERIKAHRAATPKAKRSRRAATLG